MDLEDITNIQSTAPPEQQGTVKLLNFFRYKFHIYGDVQGEMQRDCTRKTVESDIPLVAMHQIVSDPNATTHSKEVNEPLL